MTRKRWQSGAAAYVGRRGKVTEAVKAIGTLPPEERPAYGRRANQVKQGLEAAYEAKIEAMKRRPAHTRWLLTRLT